MKIFVIGSSGFVGKNLFYKFRSDSHEVYGLSTKETPTTTHIGDITDREGIQRTLDQAMPDVIVSASKMRGDVEAYNADKNKAMAIEVGGTMNVVKWARENDRRVVRVSTDYVYAGKTNGYSESSLPHPVNLYGRMQLLAEDLVRTLDDSAVLRTTVVFGRDPNGVNFLEQVLALRERRSFPSDQVSNPTDVRVLADYTAGVVDQDVRGTFVATGPETINRYKFALMIAEEFGLDKALIGSALTEEIGQTAPRPLSNGTDSSLIREKLGYKCPSLRESLRSWK